MTNKSKYVRIGTTYFKRTKKGLKDWNRQTIIDDFGKDYLKEIPRYDGFCNIPNHIDYQELVDDELNMYKRLTHVPKEGNFDVIKGFMKHVFGEQYELGLDYIQLLYLNPSHMLPILCLVSNERQTGKTTFGYFLNNIFQENATKLNQKQLSTEFNASYADKLVCFVDESKISSTSILEGLKDLSTSKTIPLRKMRTDHVEIDFFCKFILMSNHVDDFVKVDGDEIRYWIRVLKPYETFSDTFQNDLKSEIPAFLYFLQNRNMSVPVSRGRMWFHEDDIDTHALENLKHASISSEAKDLIQWMHDACVDNEVRDFLRVPVVSIYENCFSKKVWRKECGVLLDKLFKDKGEYKKAVSNANLFSGNRWCYHLPVNSIEQLCVEQKICKRGDLVGATIEATKEEVKRLEDLNLFNGDKV